MQNVLLGAFACVFVVFASVSLAFAGVTIGYQGKAEDAEAIQKVLATARAEATAYGWEVKDANVSDASVTRFAREKKSPYKGPLNGIVIYAHPMCEPIYIQFGTDLIVQSYVKTQFAGADVHVKVVELFRKLKPLLADFEVSDEGEYWETNDRAKLEMRIASDGKAIEDLKKLRPNTIGPVKMGDGRIVDLIMQK